MRRRCKPLVGGHTAQDDWESAGVYRTLARGLAAAGNQSPVIRKRHHKTPCGSLATNSNGVTRTAKMSAIRYG